MLQGCEETPRCFLHCDRRYNPSTTFMPVFLLLQVPFLLNQLPTHKVDLSTDPHAFLPSLFRTKHVWSQCRAE